MNLRTTGFWGAILLVMLSCCTGCIGGHVVQKFELDGIVRDSAGQGANGCWVGVTNVEADPQEIFGADIAQHDVYPTDGKPPYRLTRTSEDGSFAVTTTDFRGFVSVLGIIPITLGPPFRLPEQVYVHALPDGGTWHTTAIPLSSRQRRAKAVHLGDITLPAATGPACEPAPPSTSCPCAGGSVWREVDDVASQQTPNALQGQTW